MREPKMELTLRQARENKGLSKKEVAERAGISVKTLSRWEKDNRMANLPSFHSLLRVLNISGDHIYIGKEEDGLRLQQEYLKKYMETELNSAVK